MLLVAGLGNPGREHARNRHNAGWMVVDELARHFRALGFRYVTLDLHGYRTGAMNEVLSGVRRSAVGSQLSDNGPAES